MESLKTGFSILVIIGLSACAGIERHPDSGYTTGPENGSRFYQDGRTKVLSSAETEAVNDDIVLRRLERDLVTPEERAQYFRYRTFIPSARERMEFLSLPSLVARERWAYARGLVGKSNRFDREVSSLVEKSDIAVGMAKQAVRDSWGAPDIAEVAGNPELGNERWRYIEYRSTADGFAEQEKLVYFEGGKVVGWSTK